MAVQRLGIGQISFPFGTDNNLKIALEDFVSRVNDTTNYLMKPRIATVTTTYTATDLDSVILCDATSGAFTVTLPPAAGVEGKQIKFKKVDASANAVTLDGNGSETIDGAITQALSAQNDYFALVSNGTNWYIVSNN